MVTRVESWTARLVEHARNGTVLDVTPSGGQAALPDQSLDWPRSRTIPAEAIVTALTQSATPLHRFGLRVSGALIAGQLDLRMTELRVGLELRGCAAPDGLDLSDSRMPWVRVVDCILGDLRAERLRLSGNLMVHGCEIRKADDIAVALDGARVEGSVFLDQGFRAEGQIRAVGVTIGGLLSLRGARAGNKGVAVLLDGATIGRGAFLDGGFECEGEVKALGATVTGQFSFRGARLSNLDGDALSVDRTRIDGDFFLDEGFEATGHVRINGAVVSGVLSLRGAKVSNPGGEALSLDRLEVAGTAFLDDSFTARGEVRALAASIGGDLSLRGARLDNPGGDALSLDGARVDRGVFLDRGFEANGVVRALDARVQGQFVVRDGRILAPDETALNLEGITVGGGTTIDAEIASMSVRESVLKGRTLVRPDSASMNNPSRFDLVVAGATVDWLEVRLTRDATATIDLAYATVGRLDIDPLRALSLSGAVGWSLGALHGDLLTRHRDVVRLLKDLPRGGSGGFVPQPWKELANAIERAGEPSQARRLRWQAARQTTRSASWLSRALVRTPYGLVVGYGYYPLLTIAWIFALWLIVFGIAFGFQAWFVPTDAELAQALTTGDTETAASVLAGYPPLNPALYALDVALPAADTGQAASWRVDDSIGIASVFAVAKALSWALTALLVAGITGILRKD